MSEDHTATLEALRTIATKLSKRDAESIGHGTWIASGLPKGSTMKEVNDRIAHIKALVSAYNKAEAQQFDDGEAFSNGVTFKDVKTRGQGRKAGWAKGTSRASGRDKKMMQMDAQGGQMDLQCDRLYYGTDGQLHTI